MLRHKSLSDDFRLLRLGMRAEDLVILVVVFVRCDARRSAMRRVIQPAISAHVDPAVNLARHIVALGQTQDIGCVDQSDQFAGRRVVLVDESIALRSGVITDGRVVLVRDRQTVSPDAPG